MHRVHLIRYTKLFYLFSELTLQLAICWHSATTTNLQENNFLAIFGKTGIVHKMLIVSCRDISGNRIILSCSMMEEEASCKINIYKICMQYRNDNCEIIFSCSNLLTMTLLQHRSNQGKEKKRKTRRRGRRRRNVLMHCRIMRQLDVFCVFLRC